MDGAEFALRPPFRLKAEATSNLKATSNLRVGSRA